MRVEESIIIDRPPEEVFGFLSVRANDPVRMASVSESEWLDPMTAPVTARIMRRNFRADLARLKDILETEANAARWAAALWHR